MRLLLTLFLSLCLTAPAFPAGGGGGGGESSDSGGGNRFLTLFNLDSDEEEAEVTESDDPRSFSMPAVVAPLSNSYGRLTGFAYVLIRVRVASGHDVWNVQEEAHYSLDALVRVAHRINLSTEDGSSLDPQLAAEVWHAVMNEMYGEGAIEILEIRDFDVRLLNR